ncbi:PepSY domain-containing protein [Blastomonas sp.]|uniref:PepSY-associated TM helix domain-containing protein n=1 Tax=Blastomonas sp. TaxID=1909299 RepID=UPI0026227734|nr:PepSY-associated TM helix domain-containing protein [Blastomonas sp.]MDM7957460.1 PepSY-associated TM helix domain-containing protein [Blastomonas sp.]
MAETNVKKSAVRVAKALEAHSLIAVIFGGLIYILAVTGTLSVFNHEFQRWERPDAPEMTSIAPEAAERAALAVFRSEAKPTTHLYINFPQDDLPRTVITTDTQAFFANSDGSIASRETFPWTQFLLDLHYYLHMPQILGLTVVGALGAMLIALSFSGLLAHPRIFRDAFTFRRKAGRLTTVDLHNRLGVWTLPFHFSNALTGSILGLATVLAFAIAAAGFDNDTEALFAPVFGGEPEMAAGKAEPADIAGPLAYMAREYPDLNVTYVILHDPGTAGQHINVIAEHPDRLIFGDYYNFTASGEFKGNVGISDGTVGQQVTGAVYNVHFGNWGGLIVKLAYLVFGTALCTIVASGLSIYFAKRETNGRPAPRLAAVWTGLVWGTPGMLAVALVAALLGMEGIALVAVFWLGLAALLAGASRLGKARTVLTGKLMLGLALGCAIAVYLLRYGAYAVSSSGIAVTVIAAGLAIAMLVWAVRGRIAAAQVRQGPGPDSLQPAE